MQIEALNAAYVNKQSISDVGAARETSSNSTTHYEIDNSKECQNCVSPSYSYDWLDEAYALATGHKDGRLTSGCKGPLDDINWNKWSKYANVGSGGMTGTGNSGGNSSKSKLALGIGLDFTPWQNLVLSNGTSFSDLPQDAFFGDYYDFQIAIYSIF